MNIKYYWKIFRRNFRHWIDAPKGERMYYVHQMFKFLYDIERWIAFRTYDKYHIVKTGLKPNYYDKDHIILHAVFSILVDFVECELAWMNIAFDKDRAHFEKKLRRDPKFWGRVYGLCHLHWEQKLRFNKDDYSDNTKGPLTDQAKTAKVVEKCYLFYVDQYLPTQQEIQKLWRSEYYNKVDILSIEDFWEQLANKRLAQLMKVRRGLWT